MDDLIIDTLAKACYIATIAEARANGDDTPAYEWEAVPQTSKAFARTVGKFALVQLREDGFKVVRRN